MTKIVGLASKVEIYSFMALAWDVTGVKYDDSFTTGLASPLPGIQDRIKCMQRALLPFAEVK